MYSLDGDALLFLSPFEVATETSCSFSLKLLSRLGLVSANALPVFVQQSVFVVCVLRSS